MKKGFLLLLSVLLLTAAAGCGSQEEERKTNTGVANYEEPEEQEEQVNAEEEPASEVDIENEALSVYKAVQLADKRLLELTETVQVVEGDQKITFHVLKKGYNADSLKEYYLSVYTPEYADQVIANYLTEKEGVGTVIILPEDYVDFTGLAKQEITITVEGDKATAAATVNGKQVTYELRKVNGNWLVANKTVQ